jgi:RNA polymerase sigma-70 factor (ECF subfamily)
VNEFPSSSAEAVARHRPFLYKYALSRLWQKAAADDVVQETLLAALEGENRFRGDCALRTWLTGILKHKIADWHRRQGRSGRGDASSRADTDLDCDEGLDVLFDDDGRWIKPPSNWPDPLQSLENRRLWEVVDACLQSLPQAGARVFFLREIQGMSTADICAELGISESNCWVLLHRARLRLRDELERRWFDSADGECAPRKEKQTRVKHAGDGAAALVPGFVAA